MNNDPDCVWEFNVFGRIHEGPYSHPEGFSMYYDGARKDRIYRSIIGGVCDIESDSNAKSIEFYIQNIDHKFHSFKMFAKIKNFDDKIIENYLVYDKKRKFF